MTKNIDELITQITRSKDAEKSAVTLLKNLHDRLVEAGTDQAALSALAADLSNSTDDLAAAVVANTVADPDTPPDDPNPSDDDPPVDAPPATDGEDLLNTGGNV